MPYDYDLVVLGVGPAGEKGAAQAAYYGKRVACVERAPEPGGAAVHTGTLPSKTLRETAIFLSGFRQRELYGLSVELRTDTAVPRLLSRKDAVRTLEVARIQWNLEKHGVPLLRGSARFVDAHTIELTGGGGAPRRITSDVFLVATGSKPHHPPDIPFEDEDVDDSDTILQIDRLPKTMLIVGGGVIGCEYAAMFAAMHVKVTLVEGRPRLLPFLDGEIADRLRGAMQSLGVDFHLGQTTTSVRRVDGRGIVTTLSNGLEIDAEKVLASSGRSGCTEGMDLETVGVKVDKRGYVGVDGDYRTSVPSVYAAGDVIGFPALASTSMEQARVAVCHAYGFTYKRQVSHLQPFGIYTIPEVSCIGFSEEDAKAKGHDFVVGRAFYRDNARGNIVGDKEGVIKLVVDRKTRKLLGCHCIGERASELVHVGQAVMLLDGTIDAFIEMVFNYPTLSEMFKYAAYDALGAIAKAAAVPSPGLVAVFGACSCASTPSPPPPAAPHADTPAPASALDALERRLIAARTIHVSARLATSGRIQSHFDGTVAAGPERRLRVAFQGAFGGKDVEALFTCDGARMHGGPRGQSFDLDCAPGLREGFAVGFVRMGVMHNVARLAMGRTPEYLDGAAREHLEVVGAAHSEGETVRGLPTDRWTWALLVDHKPAADETLWLDARSGLPLRRRVVVHFPEGDMEVGEEYDDFTLDGPIPDDTFRIEP